MRAPVVEAAAPLRRLGSLAGVGAAAALLWFAGPALQIAGAQPLAGERERWLAIAALVALWLLATLAGAVRRARRNARLLDGLLGAPGAHEVALLERRFADAVATLRRRPGGGSRLAAALGGRPWLHELPWYLIVGAPGAGKTTALVHSGLDFPLAPSHGKAAVRGIGGTRHCDWWFTGQAVLIDTAGRYITQDSDRAADRAAWLGFLDLLVRHRPRRPIDGVLLALSAADLLQTERAPRLAHARELRARLDELQARLGLRVPVYLLVTKTDLLPGFDEFYADFDQDERAQVWGATLPVDDLAEPVARLGGALAALEQRLDERMLARLHAEPDRERRAAIHAFPQQWRVLRGALHELLDAAFAAPGGAHPLLRGIYFTSATQEGTPIDRALGALARSLGLARRVVPLKRPSGRSFFVTGLLRDVVFAEAGLAGTNRHWQRRRVRLEWAVVGAVAGTVLAGSALAWRAWRANDAHVAAVAARLDALQPDLAAAKASERVDVAALVPVLDAVEVLAGAPAASPLRSLGLDQTARFAAAAHDAYRQLSSGAFLPRLAARLEQRLRADADGQVETLYEALKAYLMLFGGRGFDAAALRGYLLAEWESTLPASVDGARRDALRRHLDALLAGGETGAPSLADTALVAKARERVAGVALPQRVYHRLQQQDDGAFFGIESLGGAAAPPTFVRASGQPRGVPALYTRSAQPALRTRAAEVLRQLAAERDWVLGAAGVAAEPAPAPLLDAVERLHAADRVRLWDAFIADLRFVPLPTLAARAELAQRLSRADSPLDALQAALARELPGDAHYEPLRRHAGAASADELRALFGKLAAHIVAVDDAIGRKAAPLPAGDAVRELAATASRMPPPLRTLLGDFAATSAGQLTAMVREPLSRQLAAEVGAPCARAVEARYPLQRDGRDEVSREDFARVFAAGGLIDGFYRRQLAAYVEAAGARAAPSAGEALMLQPFQRAQALREALFATEGGRALGLRLELRLLELDPGIGQFVLDIDGRALRFARDNARQPQTLQWPGPGAGRVQLQVAAPGAAPGAGYAFDGAWSLFRLLDRVRIEPAATADRVHLVFDVEGRKARFEARSHAALHPLRAFDEPYSCPKRF
jgi:type VI secretion system protein ImpL